jgi:CRP-like cAMP-binding protein
MLADDLRTVRFTGFLSCLSEPDRCSLRALLEPIAVERGALLPSCCATGDYVYFSQGPLLSIGHHGRVEVALVGSEGFVGWPAPIADASSPFTVVVTGREGMVLRIPAVQLQAMAFARPNLAAMLANFVTIVALQMAENIAAYASHRVDLRLSRWILLRHDRVRGDEIIIQHDEIATQLGTRRATITDTLHILEGAGFVRGRRGRLIVRDRTGMERLTAGCYGASESFYRTAIGTFGKPIAPALRMQLGTSIN